MSLDNANHRKIIDVKNWKGKKHYEWFIKYPAHYYGITKKITKIHFSLQCCTLLLPH